MVYPNWYVPWCWYLSHGSASSPLWFTWCQTRMLLTLSWAMCCLAMHKSQCLSPLLQTFLPALLSTMKNETVLQWEQKFYSSQFIAKAALVNEYIHRFWNVTLLDKLWLPFPRLSLGSMWKDALLRANKWWSSCFEEWGWECHCSQTDAERGAGKTRICVKLQDCWRTSSVS